MADEYGTLYVVATPIGNLSDISERAIETLRACDVIACEDTRVTGNLLRKFDISKEMFVNEDSRERAVAPVLLSILKSGRNVALVSDAGTPCISDPGFRIVRACRAEGVKVVPMAGACAFAAALSASGLPSDSFLFAGFLPAKTSARKNFFEKYKDFAHTLIFYEGVKIDTDILQIPHPRWHERDFVLSPLSDIKTALEKIDFKCDVMQKLSTYQKKYEPISTL